MSRRGPGGHGVPPAPGAGRAAPSRLPLILGTLALTALAFLAAYARHPAAPGANPAYPAGWFGWYDQGRYLESALAFSRHDLTGDRHVYPPLYPFLASFFVRVSARDPFAPIDLAGLLVFAYAFLAFARRYVPDWLAAAVFLVSVVLNGAIFEDFVIPWTSTLAAAILGVGILGIARGAPPLGAAQHPVRGGIGGFAATSLLIGLLVPVRPLDAVAGGILWLGGLAGLRRPGSGRAGWMRAALVGVPALAVGTAAFVLFNRHVYGNPLGTYVRAVTSGTAGFAYGDLPEKFVSLFRDGNPLYLEPGSGLVQRYPWLAIALAGMAYALIRGDAPLRAVAAAIAFHFALYFPYTDLLPNGLWRYKNVHYLKWAFPYLFLLAVMVLIALGRAWRTRSPGRAGLTLLVALVPAAVFALGLRVDWTAPRAAPARRASPGEGVEIQLGLPARSFSVCDIDGIAEDFNATYMGQHRLAIDGAGLALGRGFRLLPRPRGVRLLLIRPAKGGAVRLRLDPRLVATDTVVAWAGDYRFALGIPRLGSDALENRHPGVVRLGETVGVTRRDDPTRCFGRGWSDPEAWGTWSTGERAELRLGLLDGRPVPTAAVLRIGALVCAGHPRQTVELLANRVPVARLEFRAPDGGGTPREVRVPLPPPVWARSRSELILEIRTPGARSPLESGLSRDPRVLGASLEWFRLE